MSEAFLKSRLNMEQVCEAGTQEAGGAAGL